MSEKKNLEWICRRCEKTQKGLEIEHSTELLRTCSLCGTENWCFSVTSSRQTNTTDELVFDEITPSEVEVEAESTEKDEAVEEAVDEALEAVIEEAAEIEKAPEETPLEVEIEALEAKVKRLKIIKEQTDPPKAEIAELEAKLEALKK